MSDNRTSEEDEQMGECEHIMVSDDFGDGFVYEWCLKCWHEEINYV